jgi:hypothetical protein
MPRSVRVRLCLRLLLIATVVLAQDPDRPSALGNGTLSKDEYLSRREQQINLLRGWPADPMLRVNAVGALKTQLARRPLGPLPNWASIGPAPIPNGQTNTFQAPVSGRVTAIAVHPTNSNIAYVGVANGGVYRTTDGGTNWMAIFDSAASLAIGAIAIAPSNPSTVYVGTGEANFSCDSYAGIGLYRIDNADTTASLVGPINPPFTHGTTTVNMFTGRSVSRIVVHPTDPATILVSTTSGVAGNGCFVPTTFLPRRRVPRAVPIDQCHFGRRRCSVSETPAVGCLRGREYHGHGAGTRQSEQSGGGRLFRGVPLYKRAGCLADVYSDL